jgi:phage gpG-like protein
MSLLAMQIIGFKGLKRNSDRLFKGVKRQRLLNAALVAEADKWVQRNFQQEGKLAEGGKGWKKLEPLTIRARRKGSKRILQDTGTLRSRWKHLFTSRRAVLQSGVDYAEAHHEGAGNLPRRRITPVGKQFFPTAREVTLKFFRATIAESGKFIRSKMRFR